MIIIISGGIGSGKSLSAVKMALEDSKRNMVYTNFELKNVKNYHRLRWSDMIIKTIDEVKSTSRTEKYKEEINWEFWEQNRQADIYLDEMHNIVDSRCQS